MKTLDIYPLTLYYDASCALCKAEMSNLMRRNRGQLLVFVDVSAASVQDLPPGIARNELLTLIHARQADGSVIKGVDVFRHAYRAAGLPWVATTLQLPVLGRLADRLYPWVARNRHRFPRPLVHLLFETAIRRAARRAATHAACKPGETCQR